MTTKKDQPELTVNLKTTLQKFGGFFRVVLLSCTLVAGGVGGKYGYDKLSESSNQYESACSIEIERRMAEYNSRLTKVETRMDNTDLNIIEIKASLIRIETYLLNARDKK